MKTEGNCPLISIIVPVYNAEKYLHRCIDSILEQTFTNFELLLIDDGSTDNSNKICDEYAKTDSRIRVFHKANGGVSSARNMGLDKAKSEWICFCDADDSIKQYYLNTFINLKNLQDADLYVTGCDIITSRIKEATLSDFYYNRTELYLFVMRSYKKGLRY